MGVQVVGRVELHCESHYQIRDADLKRMEYLPRIYEPPGLSCTFRVVC
jgi:hypothetical protein